MIRSVANVFLMLIAALGFLGIAGFVVFAWSLTLVLFGFN